MAENTPNEPVGNETPPVFAIHKIYLKDSSFESPLSPQVFSQGEAPSVNVEMGIESSLVDGENHFFESVLKVTVTARLEDKNAFLVEAHQAGIFKITGVVDEELQAALEIGCPNVLLPYAREAVSEMVSKGGFPPLLINPVNFEALYRQKLEQARAEAAEAGATQ